jgi:hypothetical protein
MSFELERPDNNRLFRYYIDAVVQGARGCGGGVLGRIVDGARRGAGSAGSTARQRHGGGGGRRRTRAVARGQLHDASGSQGLHRRQGNLYSTFVSRPVRSAP